MEDKCLICHKEVEAELLISIPQNAIVCTTVGNYGSRVLDIGLTRAICKFYLCDECVLTNAEYIQHVYIKKELEPEYEIRTLKEFFELGKNTDEANESDE